MSWFSDLENVLACNNSEVNTSNHIKCQTYRSEQKGLDLTLKKSIPVSEIRGKQVTIHKVFSSFQLI